MTNHRRSSDDAPTYATTHVHKAAYRDRHRELQLLRDIDIINKRTFDELGAPNTSSQSTLPKRKTDLPAKGVNAGNPACEIKDNGTVNLRCAAIVAVALGSSSGCTTAFKTPQTLDENSTENSTSLSDSAGRVRARSKIKDGKLVATFSSHSFSSYCFDTLKCRVLYKNRYDTNDDSPSTPLTESIRNNLHAGWGIFGPPSQATVEWTSRDGTNHIERVELGEIFESRLILYAKDLNIDDVNLEMPHDEPDIILVVHDRSISVYMRAWISLKRPIDPENQLSDFRDDLILAYSQTY